jgi:hypothetical protein
LAKNGKNLKAYKGGRAIYRYEKINKNNRRVVLPDPTARAEKQLC